MHSAARVLGALTAVAGAAVPLLLFVAPVYSTASAGESSSGGDVVAFTAGGAASVLDVNPDAAILLIASSLLAVAVGLVAVTHAWRLWRPAGWVLIGALVPLTFVAVLSLPSIGVFMLPVVVFGWMSVAAARRERRAMS